MVQQQQPQDVFATNLSFAVSTFKRVTPIQSRTVERTNTRIASLDGYDKTFLCGNLPESHQSSSAIKLYNRNVKVKVHSVLNWTFTTAKTA